MRRFLTLVCLLCLAIPAGISISGCTRDPGVDYCNGLGYGMKVDDVAAITLTPATSFAYGETITVTMVDFVSDLGNFAVDPDTLTLAPGQTAEPSPMVSQLGVSSDEIAVKVALRLEKAKEARTITLRIIHAAPAPAAK